MKRFLPLALLALGLLYIASTLRPPANAGAFDIEGFGKLPVLVNGRVKPLDSVARTTLLMLQGRQRVATQAGATLAPSEWLLDVMLRPEQADEVQVFEIVHPDVLAIFNLRAEDGAGQKRFSLNQLRPHLDALTKQARMAGETESAQRSAFQRAALRLYTNLDVYHRLRFSLVSPGSTDFLGELRQLQNLLAETSAATKAAGKLDDDARKKLLDAAGHFSFIAENAYLLSIPPDAGAPEDAWLTLGASVQKTILTDGDLSPYVYTYAGLAFAWREQKAPEFNEIVRLYTQQLDKAHPEYHLKCSVEKAFNSAQPFYTSTILYVLVFLLAVFSWIVWPVELGKAAFWLLGLVFVLTTAGIVARMWLEGRPPVTNLYSSALFVGWVAVGLCVVVEAIYKNAVASTAGGFIGFCTLVIAHHLSLSGDTMEMMRAVLDSNFWLATHVVTISIGYGATFLAGFLALIYVFRGVFTASLDQATSDALARMVYGIICFATLFSLIGTILGGIWADQSWGRFWGWDPKENGALIIVIWNAVILHARWGGIVRRRGLMNLAIFGNIVTSWSWFGTNMLGVGLHSYGFMDSAFWWLLLFVASQLAAIALASIPLTRWRSKPSA
jgi:ABC-type transport system involved in cytochrome c biogenesis permease subunit